MITLNEKELTESQTEHLREALDQYIDATPNEPKFKDAIAECEEMLELIKEN